MQDPSKAADKQRSSSRRLLRPRDLVYGPGAAAVLALFELSGGTRPPLKAIATDFLQVTCLYLLLAMILNQLMPARDRAGSGP